MSLLRRRLERHGAVLAAFILGIVIGVVTARFLADGVSDKILTLGAVGVLAAAVLSDLAKDAVSRASRWTWSYLAGRRPGNRRIERSALGKTKVHG